MSDNLQDDSRQAILCDMCTGEDRKPARKTCMKCEISMCVQHLQAHMTTPVLLQTHPLTEPMDLCGTTKCPQHGKLLEYYCLDDRTCVCVSCAIEDQHRLHNMKTFSTAHKELMEKLKAEQEALKVKTEDKNVSLEKWEESEREKLGLSSLRLLEAVTKMRELSLTSVRNSVSARMVSIKTSKSSMQAAQKEKDTFRFLQMYSQVHDDMEKAKAVDLRKGLEPGSDRDKLVQEIRQSAENMMSQAGLYWESLLTFLAPEEELFSTDRELTFEPHVFGPGMSLSKDKRKVFYSRWLGKGSATLLISSTQSVSNIQRWLVSLPKDYDWTIGLCDKKSAFNLMAGPVYGLCCKDNKLNSLWTDETSEMPRNTMERRLVVSSAEIQQQGKGTGEAVQRPEAVEVYWNFLASSLSFIRRTGPHQRKEILTIAVSLNDWSLVPFVQLGMDKNAQKGSAQNWVCFCGAIYHSGGCDKRKSAHDTRCSCGKSFGSGCTTEVVCELL